MDVAREMLLVRQKLQRQIDYDTDTAMAKVLGIPREEYIQQKWAEETARQEAIRLRNREQAASNAEAIGRQLRAISDSWKGMMEGIARGFNGG